MALGDLTGNGITDIVVPNDVQSGTVNVLLGNGNGTFQSPQDFSPPAANPFAVALADLTPDGIPDLVVADIGSNAVSVLLGNGNGTFLAAQSFAAGADPSSVAIGDVNGDGIPDIVVGDDGYAGNAVSVLLGNGNGTFQAPQTFGPGSNALSVELADLSGNGIQDIVMANAGGNTVSVMLGNGNGTFQAPQSFSAGSAPFATAIGDVNGDGKPDIVEANYNTVSVLLGNGNGTFQAQQTFSAAHAPRAMALADVAGDGKLDIVEASTNMVSVLLGNGNGTFQAKQTFATIAGPSSTLALGDLNGDHKLDVVATGPGSLSVLFGAGNGNFTGQAFTIDTSAPLVQSINRTTPLGPSTNHATDVSYTVTFSEAVTGLGPADFHLALTGTAGGTVTQVTPVGILPSGSVFTVAVSGVGGIGTLGLNLVNNGSIHDLIGNLLTPPNFTGQVYFVGAVGPYVQSINRTTPAGPVTTGKSVTFTVVFSEPVTGVVAADFQLAESGTVGTTLTQVTPVNSSVYTVTVSGITGNGTLGLDLVDNGSIHDLAGDPLTQQNAPATFGAARTYAAGTGPFGVALGDLTGDGKTDIVVPNDVQSGTVSVLLGNGNGTFQTQKTFATGANPFAVALGDLTADGIPDIVVADMGSNAVSVLLGNGNGTFLAGVTFAAGTRPDSVAVGRCERRRHTRPRRGQFRQYCERGKRAAG